MKRIRLLAVLAVAVLGPLTGCAGPSAETGVVAQISRSGSQSPTPKPSEILSAAVAKVDKQNLRFTLSADSADEAPTGSFDAASGRVTYSGTSNGSKLEVVVAGGDLYLTSPELKGKWAHLVVAKVADDSGMLILVNPLFGYRLLPATVDVQQGPPGNFTGTIDLSKVSAEAGTPTKRVVDYLLKVAADKATAVAFTAAVDTQGRLSEFEATFPSADDGKPLSYGFKITDVGSAVTIDVPKKSKVIEAPASAYKGRK